MTSENKKWESLKAEYLHKVEKALSSVKHPRGREVLEDVRSHLDSRYSELVPEQRTPENFQSIITEMGPASEYAELLEPQVVKHGHKFQKKLFLIAGITAIIVIIIAVSLLPPKSSVVIPPTSEIDEEGRIVDKIDYPFVSDPDVIGAWKSVDLVETKDEFNPDRKSWKGELWLNHLIFEEKGIVAGDIFIWTKGLIINEDAKTASTYDIKKIGDADYLFFEWKSGDYAIRHEKPSYYVLKRVPLDDVKSEAMFGETAQLPPTSIINEKGHIIDKVDYPFVNDPEVIGTWKSVDFVDTPDEFRAGAKQWKSDLFLKELVFLPDGKMNDPYDTWTKGLVLDPKSITASRYILKEIDGSTYMFYEWKSGDYTIRHSKPSYYVLKKE